MSRVGTVFVATMLWVSTVASAPRPASEAPPGIEGTRHEADQFIVELKADGSYRIGQEASFAVTLTPKTGYKVNPQFPARFKTDAAADGSVKYPKPILKKEDGTFNEAQGSFNVPFVPGKTGTITLKGTLSLSVCSDKTCVMEKVTLDREIEVR